MTRGIIGCVILALLLAAGLGVQWAVAALQAPITGELTQAAQAAAREDWDTALPELPPLLQAHWDESEAALYGPQTYALDAERYACWERLGMLHVVTARDDSGRLRGYAAFSLTDCPHRPGRRLAALDGLYLAPAARKGLTVGAFGNAI